MDEQTSAVSTPETANQPAPENQTPSNVSGDVIATPNQSETPPTAVEVEQKANEAPVTPNDPLPEVLLKDFLDGKAVAYHKPIHMEIAPLTVKQIEGGGIIVTPSSQLLVKYEDQ